MPPRWNLFAAVAVLVAVALLVMARATGRALARPGTAPPGAPAGTGVLLGNVALTHGLVGSLLLAAAWYAAVPLAALGLGAPAAGALALGAGLGVGLYLANGAAERIAGLAGVEYDERLRELLAPEGALGWAVLLLGVLPVVAAAEELLFRGALIGALAAGYGLSPWPLAAASSLLFGLGHGLQGPAGVAVAVAVGLALAAAFVLTGDLLVVVVAHYLINALEFVVEEALPGGSTE